METEKRFLLAVLADFLNKRSTAFVDGLEWDRLLAFAQSHQIEAILFHQCKAFLPPAVSGRLSQLYASSLFYYSNRIKLFGEVSAALEKEGIPFFPVKGLDVAAMYPVPALRTMGDSDIIVHPSDKQKAHRVMLDIGFENISMYNNEWCYVKKNLEFEIHDHLLYDNHCINSQASKDFAELAWDYTSGEGCKKHLDWNFHLVFLLLHLKKHFLYAGIGFRQFMDLAVVVPKRDLDWDWLKETLQKLELWEFAQTCFALCEKWFAVSMPVKAEITPEFCQAAAEKIFANGVFGYADEENRANSNLNQLRTDGKLKTLIRRIFPPYKDVCDVPYYGFVRGRPWLLPVVWVYRLIRSLLCGKGSNGVKLISDTVAVDDALAQREAALRQWGLSKPPQSRKDE